MYGVSLILLLQLEALGSPTAPLVPPVERLYPFSVVYFSRGTLPKKKLVNGHLAGGPSLRTLTNSYPPTKKTLKRPAEEKQTKNLLGPLVPGVSQPKSKRIGTNCWGTSRTRTLEASGGSESPKDSGEGSPFWVFNPLKYPESPSDPNQKMVGQTPQR